VTPSPARIVKLHQRQKLGIIPQQPRSQRGSASVVRSKLLTSRNRFPRHEDIGDDTIATNKRCRGGKAQDTSPRTDECSAQKKTAVQGQCTQDDTPRPGYRDEEPGPSSVGLDDYCESPADEQTNYAANRCGGMDVSGLDEAQIKISELAFKRLKVGLAIGGAFEGGDDIWHVVMGSHNVEKPKIPAQAERPSDLQSLVSLTVKE